MTTLAPVSAALLLTAIALQAEPELKGTPVELTQHLTAIPRVVALVGEGEIKVAADRALISVKVVTENKSLQEASRVNQELRAKMARVLADKGVPAERIQASKFSSTPKYGMFGDKARSYRVENTVRITAQDEKDFQAVAGLVDVTPEFRYESIEFERSDKEALRDKAVLQAIEKAAARKQLYEEKLGVKLSPRSFAEQVFAATPPVARRYYGKPTDSLAYAVTESASVPGRGAGDASEDELPTSFGELVFKAQVTVEYTVEAR